MSGSAAALSEATSRVAGSSVCVSDAVISSIFSGGMKRSSAGFVITNRKVAENGPPIGECFY